MKLPRSLAALLLAMLIATTLGLTGTANAIPVTGLASSAALPTAQINGIVRASVVVGDTVYATGRFTAARPSGVAPGDAGEVARGNLVAFSISTGKLTSFSHTLDGEGKAITASTDGTRLFVGGVFSHVDGQPRAHLAAFSVSSGALLSSYASGPSGAVYGLAAAKSGELYVGGAFAKIGAAAHKNLAAYTAAGVVDPSFAGSADGQVAALVVTPDGSKLVAGGSFATLSGVPAPGLGAVGAGAGAADPAWAATRAAFPIRNDDPTTSKRGITSLTTDGAQIYGASFNFLNVSAPGSWEGTFAVSPADGSLIWGDNCHGDTYGVFVTRGVIYSVSHAHDCSAIGAYPQSANVTHRANAQTTTVDGVNVCGDGAYACYAGMPRSSMLTAFAPVLTPGVFSGAGQAAWTVTGNQNFVVLAGEFTAVNGKAQQGLTRMAIG